MRDFLLKISSDLQIPLDILEGAYKYAHTRCRRVSIRKASGGYRSVLQPAAVLKPILEWVNSLVISKLPVHSSATAFRRNSSILNNAYAHRNSKYSVRVDVEAFFPSITKFDLYQAISSAKDRLPDWVLQSEFLEFIGHVCFDATGRLPIGYPTSPAIANAVMFALDSSLEKLIADRSKYGDAILTRYADDFVFSTNMRGACKAFVVSMADLFSSAKYPTLRINEKKTRYMSRAGGSTLITGLRINNQGSVVVHPKYRDHVRLLMKLFAASKLSADDKPRLVGHLSFVQNVDPAFFTRLSFKFDREIELLRGTKISD